MVHGSPIYSYDEPYHPFNSRVPLVGSQRPVQNIWDIRNGLHNGVANRGLGNYMDSLCCKDSEFFMAEKHGTGNFIRDTEYLLISNNNRFGELIL